MRIRRKPWLDKEFESNNLIIENPENFKGCFNKYFGNKNPIHIEIGCGKGKFIKNLSEKNKNINFIALEKSKQILAYASKLCLEKEINNTAFILGDASNLLNLFNKNEIDIIYLNFSDPWPKKRWEKRRLTHKNFLDIYKEILVNEGGIHFKTDNTKLFEFSLNEFSKQNWDLKNISLDLHNSEFNENIMTEYEEKFSKKNMPIYRLEAYKKI